MYSFHNGTGGLTPRRQTPFGDERQAAGSAGDRGFVGATKDAEVGLIQVGVRPYDPVEGRFLGVDPKIDLGEPGQIAAAYAYAKNDPVTFSDPTGEMPAPWFEHDPPPPVPAPKSSPKRAPIQRTPQPFFRPGSFAGDLEEEVRGETAMSLYFLSLVRRANLDFIKNVGPVVGQAKAKNRAVSDAAREKLRISERNKSGAEMLKDWEKKLTRRVSLDKFLKFGGPLIEIYDGYKGVKERTDNGEDTKVAVLKEGGSWATGAAAAYTIGLACGGAGTVFCGTVVLAVGTGVKVGFERMVDGKLDDDARGVGRWLAERRHDFVYSMTCGMMPTC
ncbi:RHS repeat-associated core domain-containing protein [Pimelobacter simplex]|uniref:RHS repeat-associated core domain-containing protein n=1 Tax=Nocardioides simplex TaxID=2045 RepID=UPI00214F9511|nr:RHS repeat-associated core domain-containing protein [Pimelobacter simplex]UUW90863.1 RHS repeat-associated core domain-containing protein [Pimelobacter simplex]UUW94692.1 RHS repeat-associated core domain-containing protein [Pimelobacter simplex]